MKALLLARLLLPLCVAGLAVVAIWVVSPYLWAIFWTGLASVPVLIAAGLWWRRRMVRDEAMPPFGTGPVPALGRSPELAASKGPRKVVPGVVVASELARLGGEQGG